MEKRRDSEVGREIRKKRDIGKKIGREVGEKTGREIGKKKGR